VESITVEIIGELKSPFLEKFGAPRQPGLAPAVISAIHLKPPYDREEALSGLDQISHLWVEFVFHRVESASTKLSVRPPRLGGNKKMGVFATRSTHRPSRLGLSVVEIDRVDTAAGIIYVRGADLIDGTPIVDIKPYVPYSDIVLDATNEIASHSPPLIEVEISDALFAQCHQLPGGVEAVRQVLAQDPRPAFHQDSRNYTFSYGGYELTFAHDASRGVNKLTDVYKPDR